MAPKSKPQTSVHTLAHHAVFNLRLLTFVMVFLVYISPMVLHCQAEQYCIVFCDRKANLNFLSYCIVFL